MILLVGSQGMQSQSGSLPVVDLFKNYPLEKLRLQDMASVEYVPLETTDDILLSGNAALSAVGEKYILVHEHQLGDIYLFDRHTGKLKFHFNHKGQSGMEYTWIKNGTILDEKAEEIYVCSQFIQVYSLEGKYKRTLKINGFDHDMSILNYDDRSLLVYDDVIIEPRREKETTKTPYKLISKKDGSIISILNIYYPKRNAATIAEHLENNMWRPLRISYTHNVYCGQDLMIMNASSDTLYRLSPTRGLIPLLVRIPSVFDSEPRNIWTPFLTTDKILLFGTLPMDFKTKYLKYVFWKYEFETKKLTNVSIFDAEHETRIRNANWVPDATPAIAKNMSAEFVSASAMLEAYQKKRLKGNGNEVAKNLLEDDNQVVRILTFK